MNYKEFLRSWNPWHLRKRIAAKNRCIERMEKQIDAAHVRSNLIATECEKLKEENERLKNENRDWELVVNSMVQNRIKQRSCINKGDTHEQIGN